MSQPGPLRREPRQRRSEARVAQLLDATAVLLEEVGYDRMTTQMVADRSGMSVGAVYRYFPDRRRLARGLSLRNLERFGTRLQAELDAIGGPDSWWELTETAIDVYVRMHRDEPGFRVLRFGDVIDELLLAGDTSNNAVLAEGLLGLGGHLLGIERTEELELAAIVATEVVDALLKRAFQVAPEGDPRLIAAAKRLARDELARVLETAAHHDGAALA